MQTKRRLHLSAALKTENISRHMLKTLHIRNLALAASVGIEFRPGMNVITGETGAGKSLLIGALRLLLGERADRSMIRTGETSSTIMAEFELAGPDAVNTVLEESGLEPCDGGTLIIRRVISESNSKVFINDQPVTLPLLRRIGELLVDMHGPYDHQSLLKTETQLEILDAFGGHDNELDAYRNVYRELLKVKRQIEELDAKAENGNIAQQIEFLEYRVEEIEQAGLSADEEAEVVSEHSTIANAQNIILHANAVMGALTEGEYCAFESLAAAQRELTQLIKLLPEAEEWHDELEEAVTRIQEIARSVELSASHIDAGPERMQWLDDRLTTYQTLKRKYGPSLEEVIENGEKWKEELDELRGLDRKRAELQQECDSLLRKTEAAGKILHEKRTDTADRLSEQITRELVDLGFEHGFFDVMLTQCEPCSAGTTEIEFGFAPNAGEDMRPLRAIASSGEISRVMLAVKAVLARQDKVPLLVFDEIDANVGGEIANAVGEKLGQVAAHHQILCITHLPQVAVHGSTHFAVAKKVEDGRTYTGIRQLNKEERAEEIARMLGGRELTSSVMQHAEELISNAARQ